MQLNGKMDYPFGRLPVCENWQPSFYVGGLLPEVTVEKNGLMSKNDKFYMPKFSNEEKVHVGKMTSKFSDSNRCDVILGITITSNGNGVSYALIAIYIKSNNEFEYKVLYNNGNIHRDIIKCKVSNKTVDIYSIRSGIKLLVQVLSVGSKIHPSILTC